MRVYCCRSEPTGGRHLSVVYSQVHDFALNPNLFINPTTLIELNKPYVSPVQKFFEVILCFVSSSLFRTVSGERLEIFSSVFKLIIK